MSDEMTMLFNMMKQEMDKQTTILTESITVKIMKNIDEKIKPLLEENQTLKLEIATLNIKINNLENVNRKNNIILHGIKETEINYTGRFGIVMEIFKKLNVKLETYDINKMHRLGKPISGKIRPLLISLTTNGKKIESLQNKTKMPINTYMTEDFSKETMQKRKELQSQLREEKDKGNEVFIRNNKVIVKQKKEHEKRKRDSSTSPGSTENKAGSIIAPAKLHRTDPFAYMRARSSSLTEKTSHKA
ncbi:Endonuclease-reverse transcriptase [Operophtera brumata]|uniref:Endonuclease-reverse transcriptase n=1 Tax=Operophtera brumata TaxID=104452 RepID=A0A0L7LHT2_OPEBR|nr:Endonuclease-reverse transcriptase [Operophtera brumata]